MLRRWGYNKTELLVVVAILAIIAAIALPNVLALKLRPASAETQARPLPPQGSSSNLGDLPESTEAGFRFPG